MKLISKQNCYEISHLFCYLSCIYNGAYDAYVSYICSIELIVHSTCVFHSFSFHSFHEQFCQEVISAASDFLKTKVITNENDRVGIVLYNVSESKNPLNFAGVKFDTFAFFMYTYMCTQV